MGFMCSSVIKLQFRWIHLVDHSFKIRIVYVKAGEGAN